MFKGTSLGIEAVKGLNMVEFLSRHYGLEFSRSDVGGHGEYRCLSPFKEERNGSFFVREVEGHWLFKDFSSGNGGSLIDFILLKEGFSGVWEAINHIGELLSGGAVRLAGNPSAMSVEGSTSASSQSKGYDVEGLYHQFRRNEVGKCREYLLRRGICEEVVENLCEREVLVHNHYKGESYCCFAVFSPSGQLRCLDNHRIGGEGKFVLGEKHPFSLDWQELPSTERVFVTESIIDYLSIKTLEGNSFRGLALLGNVVNFNGEFFRSAVEIVSALDGDAGGFRAFLDLEERFNNREVRVYDFGDSKDANEYLQKRAKRKVSKRLSAQDKLHLYRDFQGSENKSEVASKWGINRSYMYEVVKECEDLILSGFSRRRAGRKPSGQPETLEEACKMVEDLESENRRIDEERERYWVRSEFMQLRLKWAEQEAMELRGEVEAQTGGEGTSASRNRKKHLKKKRRKS